MFPVSQYITEFLPYTALTEQRVSALKNSFSLLPSVVTNKKQTKLESLCENQEEKKQKASGRKATRTTPTRSPSVFTA